MYDILQSQQDGIDSLLRGRLRFFETDKSGRMTVDDKLILRSKWMCM